MRLFIAINFSEDIKNSLYGNIEELRRFCLEGSFTQKDNLHLTLVFIGETDKAEKAVEALDRAVVEAGVSPFLLTIDGFGRFKRREGDIYWMGVNKEESLLSLQTSLAKELKKKGFYIEEREYKPHLTLGRRVKTKPSFVIEDYKKGIRTIQAQVNKISLMKSEHIKGELVYTEIYQTVLY